MANSRKVGFSGRADHVTDELVCVLSGGTSFDFKDLFLVVYAGLKLKMRASGGEEILRLRCHEKLQTLAKRGLVRKTGKTYTGLQGIERTRAGEDSGQSSSIKATKGEAGFHFNF